MNKFDTVLLDLDGTLAHTMPEHRYTIVRQTLGDFGITTSNRTIDSFWFRSGREELIKNEWGLDAKVFWRAYSKYDTVEIRKQFTRIYNDVDFIQKLKIKGYKIGIVTGAPPHIASLETEMLGKENYDVLVIANPLNGIKPKPNPEGLEICLRLLKSKREKAIYVGNADEDIEAARKAKIFDVLIARGEHEFPEISPSLTIHSLYELRKLIN